MKMWVERRLWIWEIKKELREKQGEETRKGERIRGKKVNIIRGMGREGKEGINNGKKGERIKRGIKDIE